MTWVIVFVALGAAALVAIGVCAWPVWRAAVALTRQVGAASKSLGEGLEPLTAALDEVGGAQGSSARR
jgi:hypothetical protein